MISAVATGRQRCRAHLTAARAPPFWFTKNTVFGASHSDKTTEVMEKIAVHKSNAILRIITHAFTYVSRKRDVSQQNRYRCFVSDHDLKQYVKTFFFSKTSCFDF